MIRHSRSSYIPLCLFVVSLCPLWYADSAFAQGFIIAPPAGGVVPDRVRPRPPRPIVSWMPFDVKSQKVDVLISEASAETTIEQVFVNRYQTPIEGTYLFPLSESAAIHDLTMLMNGREVSAELLDAKQAREIYQSIVSRMRDPALLEYTEGGLVRAKVFPIPPGGECRIKLKYSEPMRIDSGMGCYRLPLRSGEEWARPIGTFALRASLETTRPLFNVFSPSHSCSIDRRQAKKAIVGFEQGNFVSDRDFELFFCTSDEPFGLSMLTHRERGEDGFFMARFSPQLNADTVRTLPKDICFVLDTSGSMAEDEKIEQAKRSLKFCISNLGDEDRFNIITFATETRQYAEKWADASSEQRAAAKRFVDGVKAVGGTNIDMAMEEALKLTGSSGEALTREKRFVNPLFIVFITDGEPTVGITDPAEILKNVGKRNETAAARVFVLGVGYSVNTKLLDRLADDNGGARQYVAPSEDLELKLSAFYSKLANPVLTGISIAFEGVRTLDIYPKSLPDLFKGSELVVLGRYTGEQTREPLVRVTGFVDGQPKQFVYHVEYPSETTRNEFLPRLWAMRKIGYLLDQMRLHGETDEVKEEVIRLSKRYGLMTPYTSFLVQEDEKIAGARGRRVVGPSTANVGLRETRARNQADMEEAQVGQTASKGKKAVAGSRGNRLLQTAGDSDAQRIVLEIDAFNKDGQGRSLINHIGSKTFYRVGNRWVDSAYNEKDEPTTLVLYSDAFHAFLRENGAAGRYLAQGSNVLLCWNGRVYETLPPDADEATAP